MVNKLGGGVVSTPPPGLAAPGPPCPHDAVQRLWDSALESLQRILKRLALIPGVPGSHLAKAQCWGEGWWRGDGLPGGQGYWHFPSDAKESCSPPPPLICMAPFPSQTFAAFQKAVINKETHRGAAAGAADKDIAAGEDQCIDIT